MKHRARSAKIKYQHHMIAGLRRFLEEELEPLDEVQAILPGRIERTKGMRSGLQVRFQYTTPTGAKLLAYGPGVVQEVFVVTARPERLKETLEGSRGKP